jgi:pSer/pThr/pTyr-binding forkhead associated (FHA) protein
VEDSGSTNGTFVNGARVTSARLLHAGDVIRIGHTDLLVEEHA